MILEKLKEMLKQIMYGYEIEFKKINENSRLVDDIGMTSISMLLMSISIQEEWKLEVSTTDANKFIYVKDVCDFIKNNINEG